MPLTGPVRRTNVVVREMESSLAFYRDLLGFSVFFDQEIGSAPGGRILNVACRGVRMVVLRADEGTVGMIGLMEYRDPDPPLPEPDLPRAIRAGEPFLALQTADLDGPLARVRVAGLPVIAEPTVLHPSMGLVREAAIRDPDGLAINLIDTSYR